MNKIRAGRLHREPVAIAKENISSSKDDFASSSSDSDFFSLLLEAAGSDSDPAQSYGAGCEGCRQARLLLRRRTRLRRRRQQRTQVRNEERRRRFVAKACRRAALGLSSEEWGWSSGSCQDCDLQDLVTKHGVKEVPLHDANVYEKLFSEGSGQTTASSVSSCAEVVCAATEAGLRTGRRSSFDDSDLLSISSSASS